MSYGRCMHRVDLGIGIDRPPPFVWALVTDLARTPEWRTTIRTIDAPLEPAVGVPFSGTTRLLGRTWTWELAVTAWEPPRRFAYTVTKGVATPTVEYLVEPDGDGTRFRFSGYIDEMTVVARLLRPPAMWALRRETRAHLVRLKELLEAGSDD